MYRPLDEACRRVVLFPVYRQPGRAVRCSPVKLLDNSTPACIQYDQEWTQEDALGRVRREEDPSGIPRTLLAGWHEVKC